MLNLCNDSEEWWQKEKKCDCFPFLIFEKYDTKEQVIHLAAVSNGERSPLTDAVVTFFVSPQFCLVSARDSWMQTMSDSLSYFYFMKDSSITISLKVSSPFFHWVSKIDSHSPSAVSKAMSDSPSECWNSYFTVLPKFLCSISPPLWCLLLQTQKAVDKMFTIPGEFICVIIDHRGDFLR